MIQIHLGSEIPILDYLWSSFMENNPFCFYIIIGPISEVRIHKQTIYSCWTLLYEKEKKETTVQNNNLKETEQIVK